MAFFRKDVAIEWRQKSAIASMLIYVLSTVFVINYVFNGSLEPETWLAIYWIVLLFVVVNLTMHAFSDEAEHQFYYLRTLAPPFTILAAKMLYNLFYFLILSVLTLAVLTLFFGFPVEVAGKFITVVTFGSIGLSNLFTMLSAITARVRNVALLAVLGFPIVIPLLLITIKTSAKTLDEVLVINYQQQLWALIALNVIIVALSLILFTYLWRD